MIALGLMCPAYAQDAPLPASVPTIPAAVIADPPPDKDYPAHFDAFALPSHGVNANAVIYVPGGKGPHPTVILLHGLPGAENNLDLAQAIRRAGWNVVVPHFRGEWGSPGHFTFVHCMEDAQAAVAWLRDPKTAAKFPIDPSKIVVIGHSMGGWIAGYTSAHDPNILGAALISAGDLSNYADAPLKELADGMQEAILLKNGMRVLGDASGLSLAVELKRKGTSLFLKQYAKALGAHPLLVVTADDGLSDFDDAIAASAETNPEAKVTRIHFDTNHGYNDHRIALAGALVSWLASLPGAPH